MTPGFTNYRTFGAIYTRTRVKLDRFEEEREKEIGNVDVRTMIAARLLAHGKSFSSALATEFNWPLNVIGGRFSYVCY